MKKFFLYVIIFIVITFIIPAVLTKHKKIEASAEVPKEETTKIEELVR